MSNNFPYELRPRFWHEVLYQSAIVTTMRNWLKRGDLPSFIFASGSSGVGKTSTFKLLIQATHCLNRLEGSADNCGHCAVCQSDPQLTSGYANVVWVAAESAKDADGKEITYQRSIVEALHQADRGPISTGFPHRDILFVVFEEAQLMPKDLMQRCLARADALNPYNSDVILVFLTMSAEEMAAKTRQAISQRGSILQFATPSQADITQLLVEKFQLQTEAAKLLASICHGSIRGAYSAYKDCLDFADLVTVESIALKLRYATSDQRNLLWQAIINKLSPSEFKQAVAGVINDTDNEALVKLLQQDLDNKYILLGEQRWWAATRLLGQYLINPKAIALTYLLLNLRALSWPDNFITNDNRNPNEFYNFSARLITEPWSNLRD
jgi:DNA polymerase III delta prime subunit